MIAVATNDGSTLFLWSSIYQKFSPFLVAFLPKWLLINLGNEPDNSGNHLLGVG